MTTPLFSIITVTKNAASELPSTIRSITEQTFVDYQYLIIDGLSDDGTAEIIKSDTFLNHNPKFKFISSPDDGLYDAMNKGIRNADGRYLIFLNAGDTFHSVDTLETIAKAISVSDNADILYGQTVIVDKSGNKLADRHLSAPKTLSFNSFSEGMVVCHQAFIVNKNIAPFFNTSYRLSADYLWCIQCLLNSKSNYYIDDILIDYLYGGLSISNRRKSLIERFRIMVKYYGFLPTVKNHFKFIPRYLKRQRLENNFLK